MVPWPEIMMTSGGSSISRILSSTSRPSIPVSHTSSRIRSKLLLRNNSRQSSPLGLTLVLYPSSSRMPRKDSRILDSSSTIRMWAMLACRRSADSFNRHGQFDNEAAADRLVFFHADRTTMVFHNSAHNGQNQPRAALLGRKVRQEQPFLHIARNALSRVGDHQFDGIAAGHQRS